MHTHCVINHDRTRESWQSEPANPEYVRWVTDAKPKKYEVPVQANKPFVAFTVALGVFLILVGWFTDMALRSGLVDDRVEKDPGSGLC